jgi:bacillopeptidase F
VLAKKTNIYRNVYSDSNSSEFFDDLEGGTDNLQPGGQWALVDSNAFSGTYAWDVNPGDEYQQNTNFSLELALMIEIPADAMRPELTYFDHFDIASDTTLTIEITTDDGVTWTEVSSFTSAYNRPDWVMRVVPLDAYAGQTIRLRFHVVQGSSWYRDHWLIDDVRINERQPLSHV